MLSVNFYDPIALKVFLRFLAYVWNNRGKRSVRVTCKVMTQLTYHIDRREISSLRRGYFESRHSGIRNGIIVGLSLKDNTKCPFGAV